MTNLFFKYVQNLCAKGLEAMENSHRRDLQALRIEKDNELAEETKATLSGKIYIKKHFQKLQIYACNYCHTLQHWML